MSINTIDIAHAAEQPFKCTCSPTLNPISSRCGERAVRLEGERAPKDAQEMSPPDDFFVFAATRAARPAPKIVCSGRSGKFELVAGGSVMRPLL
jgi:hypothetical protein